MPLSFFLNHFSEWTALEICGTLLVEGLQRFDYKVALFKLTDDSYLFDNFEELFEKHDPSTSCPNISGGQWILNEVRVLHLLLKCVSL